MNKHQMTAEEYRQRMIQAFHNTDCGELIAVCVLPTEKEFEHLEWLLKNHYKKEPCEDCISRQAVLDLLENTNNGWIINKVLQLPPVTPQPKTGHCKNCKFFEYDSIAKVNGIPLIVAHEICSRWGDGCKTKEDGYCFLFEPQEGSGE